MADKRLAVRIDLEFEAGKVAEQSLANAIDKMKKKAGKLDLDLQFDKLQDQVITDFARRVGKKFNSEFSKKVKEGFKSGDLDDILEDAFNSKIEAETKLMNDHIKKSLKDTFSLYKGFRDEVNGMKFNINSINFDKDELRSIKDGIRGTLSINGDAIGIDSLMQDIKVIGEKWGFAFNSDVIQDNVKQLADIIAQYKALKTELKDMASLGLDDSEISQVQDGVYNSYINMIDSLRQLENAKGILSDLNAKNAEKTEQETKAIEEQTKALEEQNKVVEEQYKTKSKGTVLEKGSTTVDDTLTSSYKKVRDEYGNIITTIKNELTDSITEKLVEPFEKLRQEQEKAEKSLDKWQRKLNSQLSDVGSLEFADKDVINEFQKSIDSLNTDSAEKEFLDLEESIKALKTYYKEFEKELNSLAKEGNAESKSYDKEIKMWEKLLHEKEQKEKEAQKKLDLWWEKALREREIKAEESARREMAARQKVEQEYEQWWLKSLKDREIQEKLAQEKLVEQMASGRENSQLKAKAEEVKLEQKQAEAINKVREEQYKLKQEYEDMQPIVLAFKKNMIATLEGIKNKYKEVFDDGIHGTDISKQFNNLVKEVESLDPSTMKEFTSQTKMLNAESKELTVNVQKAGRAWGLAKKDVNTFTGAVKDALQKVGLFSLAYDSIHMLQNGFKEGMESVKLLDTTLTELATTMDDLNTTSIREMGKQSQDLASKLSTTTDEVLKIVQVMAVAGESIDTIMNKTQGAVILSNLSGLDSSETAKIFLAAQNQFEDLADGSEKSVMRVADSIVAITKALKIDFADGVAGAGTGMKILGSLADQVGMSLEETLAILSSTVEKTQMSYDEVANALKTTISRTMRMGDATGEEALKAEQALNSVGIVIRDNAGNMKDFLNVMTELGDMWDGLTEVTQSYIGDALGGARQLSVVLAAIKNMARTEELIGVANNSSGEALKAQALYAQSLEAKMKSLTNAVQIFWQNFISSDLVKGSVDLLTNLVNGLTKLNDKFGTVTLATTSLSSAFLMFTENPIKDFIANIEEAEDGSKKFNSELLKLVKSFNVTTTSANGTTTSTFSLSAGFKALATSSFMAQVGVTALQATLSMGLSLVIGAVVGGLTALVDKMITTKEEARQLSEELSNNLTDGVKTVSDAESTLKKIKGLEEEIGNTSDLTARTELQAELNSLQREMAQLMPSAITMFDEEGNAIATNNGLIEEQIRLKKLQMKIDAETLLANNGNIQTQLDQLDQVNQKIEKMNLAKAKGLNSYTEKRTAISGGHYGMEEQTIEVDAKIKFSNDDISDAIKEAQEISKSISESYNAVSSLRNLGYDDGYIAQSLGVDIDALEKYIDSLNKGKEVKKKFEETSVDFSPITLSIEQATQGFAKATTKVDELRAMIEELNEAQEMTPALVKEMADSYPEIGAKITDATAVQEFLNEKIQEQAQIQAEMYEIMIGDDEEYYSARLQNANELQSQFDELASIFVDINSDAYNFDVNNFRSLNEAKIAFGNNLNNAFGQWIASFTGGNAQGYATDLSNFQTLAEKKAYIINAMTDQLNVLQNNMNKMANQFHEVAVDSSGNALYGRTAGALEYYNKLASQLKTTGVALEKVQTSFGQFSAGFAGYSPNLSGANIGSGSGSGSSNKDKEKEVSDLESLIDRYYEYNDVLDDINNLLALNAEKQKTATGAEKQQLLRDEIGLLARKKDALEALNNEYKKEQDELRNSLSNIGVKFDDFGNISNYNEFLEAQRKWANSLSGEDKERAIQGIRDIESAMKRYLDLANTEIPKVTQEIEGMTSAMQDKATSMLEETRNKLADAIRKKREEEKSAKLSALDERIATLREEIAALEDEDNDKEKKLLKLQAEYDKWSNDDSVKCTVCKAICIGHNSNCR